MAGRNSETAAQRRERRALVAAARARQVAAGGAHGVGTGENAHAWADALARMVAQEEPVHLWLEREPEPWQAQLLRTLNATWTVDPERADGYGGLRAGRAP